MSKTGTAFSQISSLPSKILVKRGVVLFLRSFGRARVRGFESRLSRLTVVNVGEEVEIVVEEVWKLSVRNKSHNMEAKVLTQLGYICQAFDLGQSQLLHLFCGQTFGGGDCLLVRRTILLFSSIGSVVLLDVFACSISTSRAILLVGLSGRTLRTTVSRLRRVGEGISILLGGRVWLRLGRRHGSQLHGVIKHIWKVIGTRRKLFLARASLWCLHWAGEAVAAGHARRGGSLRTIVHLITSASVQQRRRRRHHHVEVLVGFFCEWCAGSDHFGGCVCCEGSWTGLRGGGELQLALAVGWTGK
jgi:hypothetical protein